MRARAQGLIPVPRARRRATSWAVLAVVAAALAPSAAAQSNPTLDSVERAADSGQAGEARRLLATWFDSPNASGRGADVSRARFLRARLSADLDSVRVDYLWVAVRGDQRYGPAARLRLAQMYLAEGRLDRAEEDLARLRADFPGSPLTLRSWLWTGNVRSAAGDGAGACAAWETAANMSESPSAQPDRELARSALEGCGAAIASEAAPTFSVQLGAFSSREAALDLRNRVVAAGTTARVLDPQDPDGLYRVRSGHFTGREEAARHAVRLVREGFESIVVPGEN